MFATIVLGFAANIGSEEVVLLRLRIWGVAFKHTMDLSDACLFTAALVTLRDLVAGAALDDISGHTTWS